MTKQHLAVTSIAFFIFAVIFFLPVGIPYKIVFPMVTLLLCSIGTLPWQILLAFLLSAVGDALPSSTQLIPKIGAFALAHICYIIWFARRIHEQRFLLDLRNLIPGAVCLSIFVFAVLALAPSTPQGAIRYGVIAYAGIICLMACCGLMNRHPLLAAGVLSFVFSDMCLAWNLFVTPIPNEKYIVMISYYLGQYLIFLGINDVLEKKKG